MKKEIIILLSILFGVYFNLNFISAQVILADNFNMNSDWVKSGNNVNLITSESVGNWEGGSGEISILESARYGATGRGLRFHLMPVGPGPAYETNLISYASGNYSAFYYGYHHKLSNLTWNQYDINFKQLRFYTCSDDSVIPDIMGNNNFVLGWGGGYGGTINNIYTIPDTNWHKYIWEFRPETSNLANNGIVRLYVDDILKYENTTINWADDCGSDVNTFNLGGRSGGVGVINLQGNIVGDYSGPEKYTYWDNFILATTKSEVESFLGTSSNQGICEAISPGKCYYIATNGSDSNNGSFSYPWRTFDPAVSNIIKPGDYIYARAGIHDIQSQIYACTAIVCLTSYSSIKGNKTNPITYKSYPGEIAIIDNKNRTNDIMIGFGKEGIIIENFIIRNSYGSNIWLQDTPTDIVIRNNTIYNSDGNSGDNIGGITLNSCKNVLIENNIIHDTYMKAYPDNMNNANIFIFSGTTNITIRNNEMYNSVQGVFYKHSGYGSSLFENNYIHDLRESAFMIATDNILMRNNLIINSSTAFSIHHEAGCTQCSRNNSIIHNTLVDCDNSYSLNTPGSLPGPINTTIRDNIFYRSSGPTIWIYGSDQEFNSGAPKLNAYNNNYFYTNLLFNYFGDNSNSFGGANTGGIYNLSVFQSMGFEINSFNLNPLFSGGSNPTDISGYALTSNSPGYRNASDGTDRGANISLVGPGGLIYVPPQPTCPDGYCNGVETCLTCPQDCKTGCSAPNVTTMQKLLNGFGTFKSGGSLSDYITKIKEFILG